ncbi:eukaryotic translation initiation factor 2 subunit 2-like isoform X1 [Bolinopsis microptera]|uniref:eukaryotic translation initiation factor 2 subunit 2-like isoform X1 n=1 Tax=Bolinopsis microptera TaxID=2820187 RepID=UPI003078B0A9
MTEDMLEFDPMLKKKKKKKSPALDAPATEIIDDMVNWKKETDELANDMEDFSLAKKKKKKPVNIDELDNDKAMEDVGEFDPSMKKKKKKKKEFVPDGEIDNDIDDFGEFDMSVKKKKKKKTTILDEELGEDSVDNCGDSWGNSERDYSYEELLKRAVDMMRDKNPDMQAGEKKKYVMKPPQVLRHGSKKTSFANFLEICKMLHRSPKHVQDFLMAELGTSGSVDGYNQLLIKGRFQQKNIEGVLKRYIREYVTCHTCRSAETLLQKEGRLHFLQCESCGSRCSVQSIKSGFQAVTGKRKQLRDKQG